MGGNGRATGLGLGGQENQLNYPEEVILRAKNLNPSFRGVRAQ